MTRLHSDPRIFRRDRRTVLHGCVLSLLIGGFFASQLLAQPNAPVATATVASPSLIDRWLSPDAVIGGALVLLYVGELRGDVKRVKADLRAMQQRLHDDYMTRETVEARFGGRRHGER